MLAVTASAAADSAGATAVKWVPCSRASLSSHQLTDELAKETSNHIGGIHQASF